MSAGIRACPTLQREEAAGCCQHLNNSCSVQVLQAFRLHIVPTELPGIECVTLCVMTWRQLGQLWYKIPFIAKLFYVNFNNVTQFFC